MRTNTQPKSPGFSLENCGAFLRSFLVRKSSLFELMESLPESQVGVSNWKVSWSLMKNLRSENLLLENLVWECFEWESSSDSASTLRDSVWGSPNWDSQTEHTKRIDLFPGIREFERALIIICHICFFQLNNFINIHLAYSPSPSFHRLLSLSPSLSLHLLLCKRKLFL